MTPGTASTLILYGTDATLNRKTQKAALSVLRGPLLLGCP
jgi:hypothetical protein